MTQSLHPFRYPATPHVRRHGPQGYRDYRDYFPWLQDEFMFRCVYCLKRQVWAPTDIWSVEHIVSQADDPNRECDYENVVLACQFCNQYKSAATVPNPSEIAYGNCLRVDDATATVIPLNDEGRILERVLKLNHPKQINMRRRWLDILAIMARCAVDQWEKLMGFPDDLPDLKRKRPTGGNSRPDGVEHCWFERHLRGEKLKAYQ